MDELIERSVRGEASARDVERLTVWRRESVANDQRYRRTVRLLDALRSSAPPAPRAPTVDTILHRSRGPRESLLQRRRRFLAPALVAAAIVTVGVISFVLRRFGLVVAGP